MCIENINRKIRFRLSAMSLQNNLNLLKVNECLTFSRMTFQLQNPLMTTERIIVPFRSNSVIPFPNNYENHMVPDTFSVCICISSRAANASKNFTLVLIKLFETRNRSSVKTNIQFYAGLNEGMVEYTRRLVANYEDRILSSIQPGSRIAGVLGLVLSFAPSRGYEGPPPGYGTQDRSSGSFQASGGPPYPHGPSNSENLPSYADRNLYPPAFQTASSDFGPLNLGMSVPPPIYNEMNQVI